METLQTAMYDKQVQFEHLTQQLQQYQDRDSQQHRNISAALCTAQSSLTNLCTKHLICSGQRSLRSSFQKEEKDIVRLEEMENNPDGDPTRGFKESLRFFQSQVDKDYPPKNNVINQDIRKAKLSAISPKVSGCENNRLEIRNQISKQIPSVDNILSNVKTLYSNKNVHNLNKSNSHSYSSQQSNNTASMVINNTSIKKVGITRSEQTSSPQHMDQSEKRSLLSCFNPFVEPDETQNKTELKNSSFESLSSENSIEKQFSQTTSKLKNVTQTATSINEFSVKSSCISSDSKRHIGVNNVINNVPITRTFGQCKEKLELCKPSVKSIVENKVKDCDSVLNDDSKQVVEIVESDYDSHDFVVHKATFPDDYLEAISEDNYSSINDDPRDPDYNSDEEEYIIQHSDDPPYDDAEYCTNPQDSRRYVYYDEKELEVILEEDEEDLEDNDDVYKRESLPLSSEDSRSNQPGECDSGLTDDQRSSSAEECDLEDDTDSAKGSLPLPESPTIMFPNVEYHKKKRRIIEDYEKPKLKGKDVDIPDDKRIVKNGTSAWDPSKLLELLYRLDVPVEPLKKQSRYINKEGYLDKLPSGRKKATYWNPWKTKYIKLRDGFLLCFDNICSEKPSLTIQLMGGHIDTLESKMLGVDDQKGHYLVLRCSTEEEAESWEHALRSQCTEDFVNAYTSPCLHPLSISKDVIIIDLGSCSVRAGILMSQPTLPQLFFPTVCATKKTSQKNVFGISALKPSTRKDSNILFPLNPSAKITKYSINIAILPDLLKSIFQELNVFPENFKVQLSMPRNLSLQTKIKIARLLLDDFRVKGVNLTHQAILSLHAYNSSSGIIVDIGDRLDVIPIIEGYIVESGVTRLPYGGQRMVHHLKHSLAEKNISVVSDIETYIARYVLEQLCYVAEDYNQELQMYHTNPEDFEMSISTSHFFNEKNCPWNEIILDMGRFHVPEGLFNPEKWGLDNPGLHKLIYHAIQECGVDLRREMTRSIYVSGGLTLLPGFVERLENEVDKLTPDTITSKVHASVYRYHMSYIGACQIALGEKFDEICITKKMWAMEGNTCVKKWHI